MEKYKIDRINELARKKKTVGLTEDEAAEQYTLRQEYLECIRRDFTRTLQNIKFKD